MRVTIRKWGHSAAVRIPAALLEASELRVDVEADLREEDGRLVIEAAKSPRYDLSALIARITPENMHDSVSFGDPVGKERI